MPVSVISAESFVNTCPMPPQHLMSGPYWPLQPTLPSVQYPSSLLFPCSAWSASPAASLPKSPAKGFPAGSSSHVETSWRGQPSSSMKDYFTPLTVDTSVEYEIPQSSRPPGVGRPLLMVHPLYYEFRRHLRQQHGSCRCQLCLVYGQNTLSPGPMSSLDPPGRREVGGNSEMTPQSQCSGLCCRTRFPPLYQQTSVQSPSTSSFGQVQTVPGSSDSNVIPSVNPSSHLPFTCNSLHQPRLKRESPPTHLASYEQYGSDNSDMSALYTDTLSRQNNASFASSQNKVVNAFTPPRIQPYGGGSGQNLPPSYSDLFPAERGDQMSSSRKRQAFLDPECQTERKHPRIIHQGGNTEIW